VEKWARGRGRGRKALLIRCRCYYFNPPTPTPPPHQPSTGQASCYNPTWQHRNDLSSVPLRNNACTAGYEASLLESTFASKWIIKLLRRLKGGTLRFLELKKLEIKKNPDERACTREVETRNNWNCYLTQISVRILLKRQLDYLLSISMKR